MKKQTISTKVAALGTAAVVLTGAVSAAIGYNIADDSKQVEELSALVEAKQIELANKEAELTKNQVELANKEAVIAELESQEPVVINNTAVETVFVDNENLSLVLEEIYDNNGNVEYLTDDLDADEVSQIVDRIVFVNDIKALAVAEAKAEIADLVDKEVVNGEELDDRDVEKIRINDDADEVLIDDIDFDDKDATVIVTGDFKHDDVDYEFEVEVEFRDGKVEDITLLSVVEE